MTDIILAIIIICSLAVMVGMTISNNEITIKDIEWATSVCEKNEGISTISYSTVTCKNSAMFKKPE